ncbi:MAG: DUF1574 family protein [Pirellulales bacterium]
MAKIPGTRSSFAQRGRQALAWGLVWVLALHLGLSISLETWLPVARDPEYGRKLALLRRRIAEDPQRPLVLLLGSSRSGLGVRPAAFEARRGPLGGTPLVFNFAMTGAGPVHELMFLRRLLDQGIHPRMVLIEVHPLFLHQESGYAEENWLNINRLQRCDLELLARYHSNYPAVRHHWRWSRLAPWWAHRFTLLALFEPRWVQQESRPDTWTRLDQDGWLPFHREQVTLDEYGRARELAKKEYARALQSFHVTSVPDRAIRELLDLCRRHEIATGLFVMPEGSDFRSWYPDSAREKVDAYLAALCRQYQCPLVDATFWIEDGLFSDGHHLLPAGANHFSQRFGREVLQPMLARAGLPTSPAADVASKRRTKTSR